MDCDELPMSRSDDCKRLNRERLKIESSMNQLQSSMNPLEGMNLMDYKHH